MKHIGDLSLPILKPSGCNGCPLEKLSRYITPDYIVENSEVSILGQAPGQHEEEGLKLERNDYSYGRRNEITTPVTPQPLIGATGNWLRKEFWPLTRLDYSSVSRHNVIKCRPNGLNELPNIGSNKAINGISTKTLKQAIHHCSRAYLRFPTRTKYILAMGEVALYSLTGEELLNYRKGVDSEEQDEKSSTVTEWRGWALGVDLVEHTILGLRDYYSDMAGSSLYPRLITAFPVVHISSLFNSQRYYHATLHDFQRFGNLVRGTWPSTIPEIKINTPPKTIPDTIGFDTEYRELKVPSGARPKHELTMWSMADVERNVYVVDSDYSRQLRGVPSQLNIVTQNGIVDIPHLLPIISTSLGSCRLNVEDTMLAHTVKWTGEPYGLDYMLSKYGEFNRHKHLRETEDLWTKYFYSGLDAYGTLNNVWKGLLRDFSEDKLAWAEYCLRRKPLIPIIDKSQQMGLEVDQSRVELITTLLDQDLQRIKDEVESLVPGLNLRSTSQMKALLYGNIVPVPKPAKAKRSKKLSLLDQLKLQYGE